MNVLAMIIQVPGMLGILSNDPGMIVNQKVITLFL